MLSRLLLAAVDLLHEVPVRGERLVYLLDTVSQGSGWARARRNSMHILDEVLLVLGGGVDGGTLGGLGLLTAAGSEPGTSEDAAEGGHGELLRGEREPDQLSFAVLCRARGDGAVGKLTTWEPTFLPAIW